MQQSRKNWLNVFNRKDNKMPANATLWNPEIEQDDVMECHNPWLAINREGQMEDAGSAARFA
ncbi:MAG: hypothetical protein AAGK47_09030 [Bacteroidota bacterium]